MVVNLSPKAVADLDRIWTYTVEQWDTAQARRYITEIRAACEGLVAGRLQARSAEYVRPGYFKYAVGRHMLYFQKPAPGTINVIRILHQRQDVEQAL